MSFNASSITNPRSTKPSSTFTFSTETSDGYQIEQITSGVTVTMTSVNAFTSISLSSSSLVNSASNNLTFTLLSPSQLIDGDKLSITFPTQVTLPTSFTCTGVTNLDSSLTCSLSSRTLTITMNFTTDTITAGTSFSLKLASITNPSSTSPTDTFTFSISTTDGEFRDNQIL